MKDWVFNLFHERLDRSLRELLPQDPKIWVDQRKVDTGSNWKARVENALKQSKILVAIWSPPYFRSEWCCAEWQSMVAREKTKGLTSIERPHGLVYPIVFQDGKHFPPETTDVQSFCMKKYKHHTEVYKKSKRYIKFCERVDSIASEIETMLENNVPDWEDWPIVDPVTLSEANGGLTKI